MGDSRNERGPYAKGIAKRAEILEVALDVIAKEGYSGATVKRLADAVGLSQNGLLRYFGSKDALFIEVIRHREETIELQVDPEHTDFSEDLPTRILDAVTANMTAAGMSQLMLSLTAAAIDPTHEGNAFIKERYVDMRRVTTGVFRDMQQRGMFPERGDPEAAGALLVASFDGLQTQWLLDPTFDVRRAMTYLLQSLGVTEAADARA